MTLRAAFLVGAAALVGLVGCGDGPVKLATVKVEANLTVDGKAFGPATLSLGPTDPNTNSPGATGEVAMDGTVKLWSYRGQDGVVPGKYNVSIVPDPMKVGSSISTKPATVEIPATGGKVTISLELKSGPTGDGKPPSAI